MHGSSGPNLPVGFPVLAQKTTRRPNRRARAPFALPILLNLEGSRRVLELHRKIGKRVAYRRDFRRRRGLLLRRRRNHLRVLGTLAAHSVDGVDLHDDILHAVVDRLRRLLDF